MSLLVLVPHWSSAAAQQQEPPEVPGPTTNVQDVTRINEADALERSLSRSQAADYRIALQYIENARGKLRRAESAEPEKAERLRNGARKSFSSAAKQLRRIIRRQPEFIKAYEALWFIQGPGGLDNVAGQGETCEAVLALDLEHQASPMLAACGQSQATLLAAGAPHEPPASEPRPAVADEDPPEQSTEPLGIRLPPGVHLLRKRPTRSRLLRASSATSLL